MAVVLKPGDNNDLVRLLQGRLNRDYHDWLDGSNAVDRAVQIVASGSPVIQLTRVASAR